MSIDVGRTCDGVQFRVEAGLPPYGRAAVAFPVTWGRVGQEGLVVRFDLGGVDHWIGNFQSGIGSSKLVRVHPDLRRILVFASGNLWIVEPHAKAAELLGDWIDDVWVVPDSEDLVLSHQGLAFSRLGPSGTRWRTRRISWDGFDAVRINGNLIQGLAWTPLGEDWLQFEVDLDSGKSRGGSYIELDGTDGEHLADDRNAG